MRRSGLASFRRSARFPIPDRPRIVLSIEVRCHPGDLMVRRVLTIAITAALAAPLAAQARPPRGLKSTATTRPAPTIAAPPSADSLTAITRRGRAIAEVDSATWLASGAIEALSSREDGVRRLIARRTERGWEVALGALSSDESAFLITRLATPGMQTHWASSLFDPPRADTGYYARAARAIESSLTMFRPAERRPYIATVIPGADGPWWLVYIYPAP